MIQSPQTPPGFVLCAGVAEDRVTAVADALRAEGVDCTVLVRDDAGGQMESLAVPDASAVVVDASSFEDDALALLESYRHDHPDATTVLLGSDPSPSFVRRAYASGVDRFVHDGETAPTVVCEHLAPEDGGATSTPEDGGATDAPGVGEHVEALAGATSDAIVSIDATSTIRYANPAVEDVFGYDPTEVVGEPLSILMNDQLAERHREGLQRYLESGERSLDWENVQLPGEHADGHEVPLSISFAEFTVDDTRFFTGVIRDVTERRRLEAERELYHDATQRILQADSFEAGLRVGVDAIGSAMHWAYGEAWTRESDGTFTAVGGPYVASPEAEAFAESTRTLPANPSASIVGRVWESGSYEWTSDVTAGDEPFVRADAAERAGLYAALAVPIVNDGDVVAVLAFFLPGARDVDEPMVEATRTVARDLGHLMRRLQAETAVREERALKDRVLQTSPVGIVILEGDGTFRFVNDRARTILGIESIDGPVTEAGLDVELLAFDGEPVGTGRSPHRRVIEDGEELSGEVTVDVDGETRRLAVQGAPLPDEDGEESAAVFSLQDVTERQRYEERLAQLNEVGQALTTAETTAAVADVVVEGARELLDRSLVALEHYDADAGSLSGGRRTDELRDAVGDGPLLGGDRDVLWEVLATDEERHVPDLAADDEVDASGSPLESVLAIPLGTHGVFVVGGERPGAFSETDRQVARILAANAVAALDRVDREQRLREKKGELEDYTRRLERINRLNGVIRGLTARLTQASSREEIEETVPAALADVSPYVFAWVGRRTTVSGEVEPQAQAGDDQGFLATRTVDPDASDADHGPPAEALRTLEPTVRQNLQTDPPFESWRAAALQRDFRSCLAVPLTYRDTTYGVLTLYADETDVFDEMETAVFAELGETIGYAINALERKKALVSDATVELTFELDDEAVPAVAFAAETGGEFGFENHVEQGDGTVRVFFTVRDADPETVESFAQRAASINEVSLLAERDEGYRYEGVLADDSFVGDLLAYGAHPTAMETTPSGSQVTVEFPDSGDVQAFVRTFVESYAGAELVSLKRFDRPVQTRQEFEARYRERLTERQEEVLQTAYFSGFFEWPRDVSGTELAAKLGVSQPTVSRHIRKGERKLFEVVFDDH